MKKRENPSGLEYKFGIFFESYGVGIGIYVNKRRLLGRVETRLRKLLPNGFEKIDEHKIVYKFFIRLNEEGVLELFIEDEKIRTDTVFENFFGFFDSQIRLKIAENALGKVFLHAGVVCWKDRAIIIPARSFKGKTTLVAELVKQGAIYYSDEYAVLDDEGFIHPFAKRLSLRGIIDDYNQVDRSVASLGGKAGQKPIPAGMVLITEYEARAKWEPEILTKGQGMMEMLSHTIPIRNKPEFSLNVLKKIVNRAIIAKSKRGEAKEFAKILLEYFESSVI